MELICVEQSNILRCKKYLEEDQVHFSSSNGLIVLLLMHLEPVRQFLEVADWLVDFGRFYFRFFSLFPCRRNKKRERKLCI